MYETPNSFTPADVPYPHQQHSAMRAAIVSSVQTFGAARGPVKDSSASGEYGNTTPPALGLDTSGGVEEYKGGSPDYDNVSVSNKRKQLSPVASSSGAGGDGFAGPTGSTSKYRYATLPPAFNDSTTANTSLMQPTPSSPCYDAPTPRSAYRPKPSLHNGNNHSGGAPDRLASSVASPSADDQWVPPPPPDSPMDSAHSTFSQMVAAQNKAGAVQGESGALALTYI